MTKQADVRFYAGLRDFLATDRRSGLVTRTFDVPGSVKDMIEACGVPHTEVDVILVGGEPVDFSYRVEDGDRISVYPPFVQLDVAAAWRLTPEPPRPPGFVLDAHLGTLARHVRLLGFDALYDPAWDDPELVALSTRDDRVLLTRDIGLLMHGALAFGYFVRAVHPETQLVEVARRYDLAGDAAPFTRCLVCNGLLHPADRTEVLDRLPPRTRRHFDEFQVCDGCGRVYWQGSHYARLRQIVQRITGR